VLLKFRGSFPGFRFHADKITWCDNVIAASVPAFFIQRPNLKTSFRTYSQEWRSMSSHPSRFVTFESLEARQLLSATAKFSATTFYFNDVQASASGGSGSSPTQGLKISNTGTSSLTIPSGGLALGGTNKSEFTVGSTAPITISAGSSKTINLAFKANAL